MRTPLVAGYIWLLTLWVVARQWLHDYDPGALDSFVDDLWQLSETVGWPIIGAAITLVAYLVGTLLTSLTIVLLRPTSVPTKGTVELTIAASRFVDAASDEEIEAILTRADKEMRDELTVLKGGGYSLSSLTLINVLDDEVVVSIRDHLDSQTRFHFLPRKEDGGDISAEDLRRAFAERFPVGALFRATREVLPAVTRNLAMNITVRELHRDLRYVPTRLIGNESELYSEYDRVRSESEFRVGVALPISAFLGVATWATDEFLLLAALILPASLLWEGWRRHRLANYILTEAIAAGRIATPALTTPIARDAPPS